MPRKPTLAPPIAAVPQDVDDPARINPFLQAIRPAMTQQEISEAVRREALFDPRDRERPASERQQLVLRLDDYVEMLPRVFELENRITALIRRGYERRNPLPLIQQRTLAERFGLDPARVVRPEPMAAAGGSSLIGFSGVGKTTAVQSVLFTYPQIHTHTQFEGFEFHRTQLVWIRVPCPITGGARTLVMNIFQEIDRHLGTDYHARYSRSNRSAGELIQDLLPLLSTIGLGILVIDEIQRLVRLGPDEAGTTFDLFTHLRAESQVPVLLVGTPKAMRMLNRSFEQARRNTSLGGMRWQPMENDETWRFFLEGLWKYQWLTTPTPLSDELADSLHRWSQGITDIAVKIFKLAQFNLIGSGQEVLTPEVFRDVVYAELEWLPPWIPLLAARVPELMDGAWDSPFDRDRKTQPQAPSAVTLSGMLAQAGYKVQDIQDILAVIAAHQVETSSSTKSPDAPKQPKPKRASKVLPADAAQWSYWQVVEQRSDVSGYEALLQMGHVRALPGWASAA